MTAIYLLIPISVIILFIAARFFVWAVNNKQFNDLENIGKTMLFEEQSRDKAEQAMKTEAVHNHLNQEHQNSQQQTPHTTEAAQSKKASNKQS